MIYLLDTCAWIEWLIGGKSANILDDYFKIPQKLLVPTILQFELYRWVAREKDDNSAVEIIALTEQGIVVPLNTETALTAADVAKAHKLAMADAIIYATATLHQAKLITLDKHFSQLADVTYIKNAS